MHIFYQIKSSMKSVQQYFIFFFSYIASLFLRGVWLKWSLAEMLQISFQAHHEIFTICFVFRMMKRLLCLSAAWFVCYQAHKLLAGLPGKDSGAMAADNLREADQPCQKPSNIWAFLPLVGKSLATTFVKKYRNCLKRKASRRLCGAAVHVMVKVFLAADLVAIVSVTKMIVERILCSTFGHRKYVD